MLRGQVPVASELATDLITDVTSCGVYPSSSQSESLTLSGLERLYDRRERLTKEMFKGIHNHNDVLHDILSVKSQMTSNCNLRIKYENQITITKKTRYGRDFLPY
jgi:hypothetical protein